VAFSPTEIGWPRLPLTIRQDLERAPGQPSTAPLKHDHWVVQVQFSADGTRLLTSSRDQSARVWDVRTGRRSPKPLRWGPGAERAASVPMASAIVATTRRATWPWISGPSCGSTSGRDAAACRGCPPRPLSPDGQRVATASWDETVRVWDPHSGQPLTDPLPQGGRAWFVQFSKDGRQLAVTSDNGLRVLACLTGKNACPTHLESFRGPRVRFSPDGQGS